MSATKTKTRIDSQTDISYEASKVVLNAGMGIAALIGI